MSEEKFVSLILDILNGEVKKYEVYGDYELTVNLKDVNLEIDGVEWEKVIKDHLKENGCDVRFSYGDGNWATIHKIWWNILWPTKGRDDQWKR